MQVDEWIAAGSLLVAAAAVALNLLRTWWEDRRRVDDRRQAAAAEERRILLDARAALEKLRDGALESLASDGSAAVSDRVMRAYRDARFQAERIPHHDLRSAALYAAVECARVLGPLGDAPAAPGKPGAGHEVEWALDEFLRLLQARLQEIDHLSRTSP